MFIIIIAVKVLVSYTLGQIKISHSLELILIYDDCFLILENFKLEKILLLHIVMWISGLFLTNK